METFVSYGADGTVLQLADGSSITFHGDVDMSAVVAQFGLRSVEEGVNTPNGDAGGDFDTQYTIEVGDSVDGALDFPGDRDWFAIELEAGQVYDFANESGALQFSLHNAAGSQVADNIYGGGFGRAQLYYQPETSGTYYLGVESSASGFISAFGSYDISVSEGVADSAMSFLDVLQNDYWDHLNGWEAAEEEYRPRKFEDATIYYNAGSVQALPEGQESLVLLAMRVWEDYTGVDFVGLDVETETEQFEIVFQNTGAGAFTNFQMVPPVDPNAPPLIDTIQLATINVGSDIIDQHGTRVDSFSFLMHLYTLGRALGLGNAGFYDERNDDPGLPPAFGTTSDSTNFFFNDSWQMSVMSAFGQDENFFIDATRAFPATPMMADILTVQSIYGTQGFANTGDTVYGANSTATGYGGLLSFMMRGDFNPDLYSSGPVAMTLYDTGGNDTIDASFSDAGQTIRLTGGSFSDIGGYTGNVAIYLDTVIENAIGGGGNDTLLGNAVGNRLEGGAGDDVIDGGGGTDTAVYAIGSTEAEVTVDEDGVFEVVSSLGTDTLANIEFVAFADKTVRIEELARFERVGGDRSDIIFGFDLGDSISGLGGDDELFGLAGDDIISGGNGADLIEGGRGNDILFGDAGDDTIYGDAGQDSLNGGTGDDLLTGGAGADVFVFLAETETGSDRILDFSIADADRIALDSTLWGRANLTAEEVIDQYAVVVGSSTVFVFDGGQSVTIDGVANPMSLVDHIDII
jgi:serralysin